MQKFECHKNVEISVMQKLECHENVEISPEHPKEDGGVQEPSLERQEHLWRRDRSSILPQWP